jgi:Zn finger protein HypA/HybF involved in hydrogenase expression
MLNFTTYCGMPALCPSCQRVVVANVLQPSPRCPHCGGAIHFYAETELHGPVSADANEVFSWRIDGEPHAVSLPDTTYLCPRCRRMHMHLEDVGNWD